MKIANQFDLKKQIFDVLSYSGPVICELIVDQNHKTLPKASVYKKQDGSFSTRPMEDLFPFLDRNEFRQNLIISEINYETI